MGDRPEAKWEPGTLDNTRRNIGPIDEDEAKKMMKKLGGEVFVEKSAPIDYSALPKAREYSKRVVGRSASSVASGTKPTIPEGGKVGFAVKEKPTRIGSLPELTSRERHLMDRLMMSEDYKIKTNYGLFNFVRKFKKNGDELVRKSFIEYNLQKHVEHLQEFITTVKSIIQISPDTYKSKILTGTEDKFKFLKTVGSWTMKDIKKYMFELQDSADECTVAMMIPFVKEVYRDLIKIYYLGETKISNYFKEIYADLAKYPKFDLKKAQMLSKTGITEWFYIYSQVIKGLYPLLMRMSSTKFDYFQDFFLVQTGNILSFLELTKFDLLLPNKKSGKPAAPQPEEKSAEEKPAEKAESKKEDKKSDFVEAGIKLLDNLFPQAGFNHLEKMPDMYPYFQPIYQFRDGYNLLAPENPLQITVTLLRITEDIFQGCRNIVFTEENEEDVSQTSEKLSTVLSEWSVYREILFERQYADQITDFVNNEYSQGDYKSTLFGKKMITSMLWQTKYNFLPYFEFEQLLLEKPKNDSQFRPLCIRIGFLLRYLTMLAKNIDAAKGQGMVMGIQNPWDKYKFDIPNAISKRMDVLLGAKKADSAATNANLIKYALFIIAVLDWWVNSPASPAYSTDSTKIYRVNEEDGAPAFSVPTRSDQNKLFAERVKQTIEKQKASAAGK
ncbi:MAG: hypothetical protein IJ207_11770 [Treponema sp.]|uniref:hypothetical protein n=1 Tax=Treponema sp. TaxID=166 RepID=UPI0025CDCB33|nr:hypothetical protein [Treponema sp.]MBQ9282849.1 hypothetical protein [Treponema sp.]